MAVLADETRSKSGLKRKHGTGGVGRTLRSLYSGCRVSEQFWGRVKWSRSGQAGTKNDPNSTVPKM